MIAWKPKSRDKNIASVRYRCLIPLEALQISGNQIELFEEKRLDSYNTVIFSKLYDEKNLRLAQQLKARGSMVVLDICDNHLYNPYNLPLYAQVRSNLLQMLALSDLVVCSTEALADALYKEAQLSARPLVVGDPVENLPQAPAGNVPLSTLPWHRRLFPVRSHAARREHPVQLLWFGNHGSPNAPSGMQDIVGIAGLLEDLANRFDFELRVLSNDVKKYHDYIEPLQFPTSYREWNYQTFRGELASTTAVLIPITLNPFSLCKTNNRLALALKYQVPVIADNIPSYEEFAPYTYIGRWEEGLVKVLSGAPEVADITAQGKQYVQNNWEPATVAENWQSVIAIIEQGLSHSQVVPD